jgi:signal transduction histidine kinase
MVSGSFLNTLWSRLSARLLVLTALFVMLAEVLIYVPSIAEYRRDWLEDRLNAAQIAALALEAASDRMVSAGLAEELLSNAGVEAVVLKRSERRLLILGDDMPINIAARYDLRDAMPWTLIRDAAAVITLSNDRLIEVTGHARQGAGEYVQIMLYPAELKTAMLVYSRNILLLSLMISFVTAGLVYVALSRLMVAPIRRITASVVTFRAAPESERSALKPSTRSDEIGVVERELAKMQTELRAALLQKNRLANLGVAVSKINHDLRNILSSAQLLSDRLRTINDPTVQALAPRFMKTIDRAIRLCNATLEYGHAPDAAIALKPLHLRALVAETAAAAGFSADGAPKLVNEVPDDFEVRADGEQLFRVILNLLRNAKGAIEAAATPSEDIAAKCVTVRAAANDAHVTIDVIDQGPGLPPQARAHLFEPFRGSAATGGTGLGLAIAHDIMVAHGGSIQLLESGPGGTVFRLTLPN